MWWNAACPSVPALCSGGAAPCCTVRPGGPCIAPGQLYFLPAPDFEPSSALGSQPSPLGSPQPSRTGLQAGTATPRPARLEMQRARPGECKWCSRQIRRRLSSPQHSGVCRAWWGNRAFSPHLPAGQVSACSPQGSPEGQALWGLFLRPPPSSRRQQVLCRIPFLSTGRQLSPCREGWAKGCTTTDFPCLILNLDPPADAVSECLPHPPPPSSHLLLMALKLDQPTSRGKEAAAIARGVQVSTLSPGRRTRRMEWECWLSEKRIHLPWSDNWRNGEAVGHGV